MNETTASFPDFPLQSIRFKAGSLGLTLPEYSDDILRGGTVAPSLISTGSRPQSPARIRSISVLLQSWCCPPRFE